MEDAVGMAMGYVASSMSVALLIAPTVGGAVYAAAGYYAVYYIAFGVVLVDILLRLLMIEKKVAKQWLAPVVPDSTPNAETVVEKTAAAGPQRASQEGHHAPADTRLISTQANMATGALPESLDQDDVLTRHNTGSQRSGLRSRPIWVLLKSPRLLAALYAILVQAGIMMGFDAVLALFVQSTFHWNSIAAGLMFIAIFLPGFISPLVGWLADKYGAKWLSFAGYVATIPPVICLRFVTEDTIGHKVLLAVLLAIIGVSLAFSNTPLMAEITYVIVEKAETNPGIFGEKGAFGIGYGLFTMAFAAGGVVGPLWAGYVNDSAGWGTAMWSLGVWAASGAVVVVVWLGSKSPQKKQDNRRQQQQQQQGDTEGGREAATTPALV
ncbi:hypothetical protein E8E14_003723 [Neopestalotiopsis sp. 37M]|nr:hypothetical protein E8E14_003723 [Neopestalotiopsis sp. 37M]